MKSIEVTVNGVTDSLTGWARRIGVSRQAVWAKVRYQGKSPEDAVRTYIERRGYEAEAGDADNACAKAN